MTDRRTPLEQGVRWQYRVVNIGMLNAPQRMAVVLGKLGSQGWELVAIYDKASNWLRDMEKGFVLFKRAVPPGAHPEGAWGIWETSADHMTPLPLAPSGTAEGWLPDPSGRFPDRYWSGKKWTEYVRDEPGGTRFEDPAVV